MNQQKIKQREDKAMDDFRKLQKAQAEKRATAAV